MTEKYELIPDLKFIQQEDLFKNSYYLLGSESLNSFLKMKPKTYEYTKEVIELFKQNKSKEEIDDAISQMYPDKSINVEQLVTKLKEAGLIKGYEKTFDDEMTALGLTLFKKNFPQNSEHLTLLSQKLYAFLSKAFVWLPLIVTGSILIFLHRGDIEGLQRSQTIGSFLIDTITTILLTGLCFLFHELGHAISAINNKVKLKSFSFGLYLGIIPTFYFHYYNLKTASSKTKLKIVIAGIYVNSLLAGISYLLTFLPWNNPYIIQALSSFAVLNLLMILGNLLPTRLSDGYYLLALLFNKFDMRISFWRNIFYSKKAKSKFQLPLLLYFCIMIGAIFYTLASILSKALSFIEEGNNIYGYGLLGVAIIMFSGALLNAFIRLRGVNGMTFNIIKQRFKINTHRKNNLAVALIVALLILIITAGTSVYENAKFHAINNYWSKVGTADIIAAFPTPTIDKIDSLLAGNEEITYAYFNNTRKNIELGQTTTTAIIAYGDIANINRKLNLDLGDDSEKAPLLVNSTLMEQLACALGDEVVINGKAYTIGALSNKVNFLAPQKPLAIINTAEKPVDNTDYSVITFAYFGHDQQKVITVTEALENYDDISYINQFAGSQTIESEFKNLENILFVLLFSILAICLILIYTSFTLNLKNNLSYWAILRSLGLTKKKMLRVILVENTLFSFLGSVLGYFFGVLAAYIICLLTNTSFSTAFSGAKNSAFIILIGMIASLGPAFVVLRRHLDSSPLSIMKVKKRIRTDLNRKTLAIISFVIGALLIIGTLTINPADYVNDEIASYSYIVKISIEILAILLITIPSLKGLLYLAGKVKAKTLKLSSYLAKINSRHIIGISISLVLCLVMLGTLLDFSYSFKSWACELADSQLSFDARAMATNNSLGAGQMYSLLSEKDVSPSGEYYLSVGKISDNLAYLIAESAASNEALQKIYRSPISFSSLKENEAIVSNRLLNDIKANIGDTVKVSLNEVEREVKIVSTIETQDYASYLVVVANSLFSESDYKYYCANIKIAESTLLRDLKSEYPSSIIKFYSQDELAAQWESSIVSGVDILISIVFLIVVSLLLMLRNSIRNSILDRKKDFAILRTMGVSKKGVLKLLAELSLFQAPTVIFSIAFSPLIARSFVEFNSYLSGYQVSYKFDFWSHLVIWLTLVLVIFLIPIRIFIQAKNESPIDSIKSL